MSSFDKVVKLACKPKAAPPKAKYLDPIIAATWSDDGAIHDVCKALVPRIREPNAIVVFKGLIVLHTMIRNGATDNVLSYLSSSDTLRLRNVSSWDWEGYAAPQNLQAYSRYLDARIHTYKELKHDVIKVQADNNRDMRNSLVEEDGQRGRKDRNTKPTSVPTRSKTIMGRKLRSMTVEKGLLRETKAVHNMLDALVECRFYLDDLEDELTITALRMLVKDLLILFQAGNEGVINVLESYFEMSHVDAEEALNIYRHFCKQTEFVVEYLGVARKLQNLLNVPIPNLKHAPVSLAGALQEYLDDPNFEQNRIEYKLAAQGRGKTSSNGRKANSSSAGSSTPTLPTTKSSPKPAPSTPTVIKSTPGGANKDVTDFFSAIEEEQPTMFNPATNSPSTAYFQQQSAVNPFSQMITGQPQLVVPQHTAMPQQQPNPFGNMLVPQQTGHRPFSSYLPSNFSVQPQQTGFTQQPTGLPQQQTGFPQQQTGFPQQQAGFPQQQTGFPQQNAILQSQQQNFLQPQVTGGNPFRQSMLVPQTTGMALFGVGNQAQGMSQSGMNPAFNPQGQNQSGMQTSFSMGSAPSTANPMNSTGPFAPIATPFGMNQSQQTGPARPASTPLTSKGTASPPLQAVKSHQTGSRNPFGLPPTAAPPVPKTPTLFELSTGMGSMNLNNNQQQRQQQQQFQQTAQRQQPQQTGFSYANSALNPGSTDMSSVASSFNFSKQNNNSSATQSQAPSLAPTTTGSTNFSDSIFSSLSSQQTGATATSSSSFQPSSSALRPQMTGFSTMKPFKPTSSFGASLLDSLPPIPGSGPTTPAITGAGLNGTNSYMNSGFNGNGTPTNGTSGTSGPGGNNPPGSTSTPGSLSFLSSPPNSAPSGSASFGILPTQRTGATGGFTPSSQFGQSLGVGLRPQMTGGGSANPFRASMAAPSSATAPNFGSSAFSSASNMNNSLPPFNPSAFGSTAFSAVPQGQQQQNSTSLI